MNTLTGNIEFGNPFPAWTGKKPKLRRAKAIIYETSWNNETRRNEKNETHYEGNFHQWGLDVLEDETGFSSVSVAIIELDDGKIITPYPENVEFINK